SYQHTSGLTF
nr:immunoglobulin light chain junction region [Macaca mulatta]